MAPVVHARHLSPRVVHGVVAKQTVGRVGAIFGRYTTGDVDEPVQTGHAGQSNRLIARHAGTVAPVPVGGIVDLHQSRRLNGGIGIGVVVADGVDGIAHHGALVVLLRFLKLLNGRHPCFVDKVKHLNGLRVGFIARLRRVDVNASADEKDFLGRRKVGRARTGSHLGRPIPDVAVHDTGGRLSSVRPEAADCVRLLCVKPFDFAKLITSSTVCFGVDVPASKTSLAAGFAKSGEHETAIMTRTINTVVQRWRLTMSYGHARSLNTLPVVVNGRCMPSSQRRRRSGR